MDGFYDIDRMAYAGGLPWHGRGKNVSKLDLPPTREGWTAMQQHSGSDFTYGLVPLRAADTGEEVPGQYTVRCSDGHLVGDRKSGVVVGRKYTLVQPATLAETMAACGVKPHTMGTLLGRRRMWALGQLPGHTEIRRREGDRTITVPFLFGSNSADGSSDLLLGFTGVYVVCWNTVQLGSAEARKGLHVAARHTASVTDRLATAAEVLGLAEAAFKADAVVTQRLADTPYTRAQMQTLACQLITGEDDAEKARETVAKSEGRSRALYARKGGVLVDLFANGLGCRGNSKLDALNAATEYVDHSRGRTGEVDLDTVGASILWGAGAQLKQRALALMTAA